MVVLKYYFDLMSQPCRALYIFLKLTKIPFEPYLVALRKGEHNTEDFKENFNRFQKVPFIHHGEFKLAESVAILAYLTREFRHLVPNHWYPIENKGQAKVEEYLAWQHLNTRLTCASYTWFKYFLPLITKSEPDEAEIADYESKMIGCLDEIEELWLSQGHKFIAGDQISVADIFAACELEQPRIGGFDITKGRPVLKKWLDSVKNECKPYYDEAHEILNKIVEHNKKKSKL